MSTIKKQPPGSTNSSGRATSRRARLTRGTSGLSPQMSFLDSLNATSSPGSVDGVSPCVSLDGPTINPSGPAPVRVLRSRAPEKRSLVQSAQAACLFRMFSERATSPALAVGTIGSLTDGTFGRSFRGSSASARLQSSLESRLRRRTDLSGSLEYALTWKTRAMVLGPVICALRASGHRTSAKDFSGRPTPLAAPDSPASHNQVSGQYRREMAKILTGWPTPLANKLNPQTREDFTPNLAAVALLAGWPTARANDGNGSKVPPNRKGGHSLKSAAQLTGWCSPSARDWKDTPGMATTGVNPDGSTRSRMDQLPRQAAGVISTSFLAPTENRGALNPAFSRWLMGYPAAWDSCGATAMQLSRKSQRSSSAPTGKQGKD